MNRRMDRNRLNIGAYILQPYARTERHIREIKECGIDFIVCMGDDRPALDLFEKYGLGAVVSGIVPGWWGGDGENAGLLAERNPLERYGEAASGFRDHPAVWGIDVGDEPSALDFPHYGKVTALTERLFANQFAYLNLYPNYASVAENSAQQTVNQLGTATYDEHIRRYCENVGLDYICYDFYMYSLSADRNSFFGINRAYENLRVVADACRSTGRAMWIVLQVNSNRPEEWLSADQLRFQANSALAFGAEVVTWACYTGGWWHNQVLDGQGEKTEQYEKLKTVNAELRAIGRKYMKYRNVSTHFIGFKWAHTPAGVNADVSDELNTGVFFGLRASDGSPLLAGQMVARDGSGKQAVFICNASEPWGDRRTESTVEFCANGAEVHILTARGEIEPEITDGKYRFSLPSCGGALLTIR
ncbi:MAG: hypothetical protein K6C36_08170 [Clostridia bacterium]|nr:hypothetical protein [Clostridia bacterium]